MDDRERVEDDQDCDPSTAGSGGRDWAPLAVRCWAGLFHTERQPQVPRGYTDTGSDSPSAKSLGLLQAPKVPYCVPHFVVRAGF